MMKDLPTKDWIHWFKEGEDGFKDPITKHPPNLILTLRILIKICAGWMV